MMKLKAVLFILPFTVFLSLKSINGESVQLNSANLNEIITSNEIVFVNFYADWCRFSQILKPVFDDAAKKVKEEFSQPGKVEFAKVDCDAESGIAANYRITKYPTLKLFRNGHMVKKEYRGQRSAESIADFIKEQLRDPVIDHKKLDELDELDAKKRHMIGFFEHKESDNYKTFVRVASHLRDNCQFHSTFGEIAQPERTSGDRLIYRAPNTKKQDIVYAGSLNVFDHLLTFIYDKCVPLVREITFENAEELTEEGLPFLILFHKLEDQDSVKQFEAGVQRELLQEKNNVNFLIADGSKFTHPLHHLGKTVNDLPVLAIDSFRHMYIFPHDAKTDINTPGLLKTFIEDLHSGKLHREFHHGPDPVQSSTTAEPAVPDLPGVQQAEQRSNNVPLEKAGTDEKPKQPTSPPESSFKKLAPSRNRYTILKDEL